MLTPPGQCDDLEASFGFVVREQQDPRASPRSRRRRTHRRPSRAPGTRGARRHPRRGSRGSRRRPPALQVSVAGPTGWRSAGSLVHVQPSGSRSSTCRPAGMSTVSSAGASDGAEHVHHSERRDPRPVWSGSLEGTVTSRSAASMLAHTALGSDASVVALSTAAELQARSPAAGLPTTLAVNTKLRLAPASSGASAVARMAWAPAAVERPVVRAAGRAAREDLGAAGVGRRREGEGQTRRHVGDRLDASRRRSSRREVVPAPAVRLVSPVSPMCGSTS